MAKSTETRTPPLRAVRVAHGLGLRQVAKRAGIDPGHLSRIERGLSRPSLTVLSRLAHALGLKDLDRFISPYLGDGE